MNSFKAFSNTIYSSPLDDINDEDTILTIAGIIIWIVNLVMVFTI